MIVTREINLWNFEAWSGGEQGLDLIMNLNAEKDFESYIEEEYPDGIDETHLNDILRFEVEEILNMLGYSTDEDEDEDE